MEPILSWLLESLPWLAPSIVSVAIAVAVTRYFVQHFNKIDHRFDFIDQKFEQVGSRFDLVEKAVSQIDTLPCEAHIREMAANRHDTDCHLARVDMVLDEHGRRIAAAEERLERLDERLMGFVLGNAGAVMKHSPYTLTPYGEYLLEASTGRECVDNNLDYFLDAIRAQNPSTRYDVERAALGAVMDAFRTTRVDSVKNFLYDSPGIIEAAGEKHRLTTDDVQVAMGIYLRDRYFAAQE